MSATETAKSSKSAAEAAVVADAKPSMAESGEQLLRSPLADGDIVDRAAYDAKAAGAGAGAAVRRLQRQLESLREAGTSVTLVNEDIYRWIVSLPGPADSAYHGGVFQISFHFPKDYPFHGPKVTFVTPIYHLNSYDGYFHVPGTMRDTYTPAVTVDQILKDLAAVLRQPNEDDIADAEVGKLYRSDRAKYLQNATESAKRAQPAAAVVGNAKAGADGKSAGDQKAGAAAVGVATGAGAGAGDSKSAAASTASPAAAATLARLRKEFELLESACSGSQSSSSDAKSPEFRASDLERVDGDNFRWRMNLHGPGDSPYKGGVFRVSITFPRSYPFQSPKVIVETPIFHYNNCCGDFTLPGTGDSWTPSKTIVAVVAELDKLLRSPDVGYMGDADAADLYRSDHAKYLATATEWTQRHATGAENRA